MLQIILLIIIVLRFYLGVMHTRLFNRRIYSIIWRFSFKTLNRAISETNDNNNKRILKRIKLIHALYVSVCVIFWVMFILGYFS